MKFLKKIIERICNVFESESYNIKILNGAFELVILGNFNTSSPGNKIKVMRITEVPENMIFPNIRILDEQKNDVIVEQIIYGLEWSFTMPQSDVIIVPVVKRKY